MHPDIHKFEQLMMSYNSLSTLISFLEPAIGKLAAFPGTPWITIACFRCCEGFGYGFLMQRPWEGLEVDEIHEEPIHGRRRQFMDRHGWGSAEEEHDDTTEELLPVSDTGRTYASSALSQAEKIVFGRQVRDIVVMRGNRLALPLATTKHSRRSSLSIFNSLKFWKRKPQKMPAMDIDYFSMLNLGQRVDKAERPGGGFSLKT